MENCEHKFVYLRSESYWQYCGRNRNSRDYYHADYYFCEKCLEEKKLEKRYSCYDSEIYNAPEWAKVITKQIPSYGNY